jgi:antitoxin HigA-1
MAKILKPMHPGEVLREEFLVPLKMSAGALAKACGLPRTRIERIASEQTGITADTALRLAKALGTTAQLSRALSAAFDAWRWEIPATPEASAGASAKCASTMVRDTGSTICRTERRLSFYCVAATNARNVRTSSGLRNWRRHCDAEDDTI